MSNEESLGGILLIAGMILLATVVAMLFYLGLSIAMDRRADGQEVWNVQTGTCIYENSGLRHCVYTL